MALLLSDGGNIIPLPHNVSMFANGLNASVYISCLLMANASHAIFACIYAEHFILQRAHDDVMTWRNFLCNWSFVPLA